MTKPRSLRPIFLTTLLCQTSFAQSANIDFGLDTFSKPNASYGGGAGQPGYWNQIVGSRPLLGLDGVTQIATINTGDYSTTQRDIPGAVGGDEALMETALMAATPKSMFIRDLLPGKYDLYLYGWAAVWDGPSGTPGFTDFGVFVTGTGSGVYRLDYSSGPWPGMQIENQTYLKVPITLEFGSNGRTLLSVDQAGIGEGFMIMQGMQLVRIPAPAAPALAALFACAAIHRRRR